jgi:glucose dehydrogenase
VAAAVIVGGEGTGDFGGGGVTIKGTPLMVDGTLYVSSPDNAWAIDARDGRELWHYFWKTRGGTHIANRGLGMWNGYLYMATPDNYLVSLDAKTGRERLAQDDRRLQPAVLLDLGAARRRQPRDRRDRKRSRHPGFLSPSTRRPASCSGSSTPCR